MTRALIILAKRPTPGRVKTRLTPPLSPEDASELYRCMLLDTLAKTSAMAGMERFIFYENEPAALDYFRQISPGTPAYPQQGEHLGERMENAFRRLFASGFSPIAIIGTDSPDLPVSFLEEAFRALDDPNADAIYGPAEDGGYYLLAMKRLHSELFREIPWSSGDVLRMSLKNAGDAGIRVSLLGGWHDVDRAEDLIRPEMLDEANGAPLTRKFLNNRFNNKG